MLERLGMPAWEWGDRALLRAFDWLHEFAHFSAEGDDTWLPHIINRAYDVEFSATVPHQTRQGHWLRRVDTRTNPIIVSNA